MERQLGQEFKNLVQRETYLRDNCDGSDRLDKDRKSSSPAPDEFPAADSGANAAVMRR